MEAYEILNLMEDEGGSLHIPMSRVLTPAFLGRCSRFRSLDEMFEVSGFQVSSEADFLAIPDREWDQFIAANTTYRGWHELLKAATTEWLHRRR